MSDFDFNKNFISGKTNPKILTQDDPGLALESKYIGNKNQLNQLVPVKNSEISLYNLRQANKPKSLNQEKVTKKKFSLVSYFTGLSKIKSFNFKKTKTSEKPMNGGAKKIKWHLYSLIAVSSILTIFIVTSIFSQKVTNVAQGQVAGVVEKSKSKNRLNEPTDAYKAWITDKLGSYYPPEEDFDGDQLTNEEEFIIGSEPNNPNTCNPKKTDAENLVEFINPITCKAIDLSDNIAMEKFKKVVDFNSIRSKVIQNDAKNIKEETKNDVDNSIQKLFGLSSLESLNKQEFNSSKFKSELDLIKTKQDSIDKINKINQYMKENRSLEPYDRNYPIPVNGAVYLEVSLKYNVPLKYTLAVAQRESRFGTDAYDSDGNLTRPGKYKNIFSMGLDDSGNNVGFETWEKGVESFGRWYKRYNDRGFSDCSKWRIYNPNGDYCKSIEETASQIDYFLNK
ncbi:MAG: glucosaminidase domain-containing protein [candidate division SR1 bacterium]|nr:glucosaminidase domain-containing protein [candidate division SR1 bacterium]